jgi:hypothetical protein
MAVKWLRVPAAAGNPEAQNDLGYCVHSDRFKSIVDQPKMTFDEVASSRPNGFHDAELQRFEMDNVHRTLRFDLVVWIGNMDDSRRRELYRPARLTVDDVAFLVIERHLTSTIRR